MADEIAELKQMFEAYIEATGYDVQEMPLTLMDGSQLTEYGMTYRVTKKPKKRREIKQEGYTDDFINLWTLYNFKGKGSKQDAFKQYNLRLDEFKGSDAKQAYAYEEMVYGIKAYEKFINATEQFSMQMCRFLGKSKHYKNDWSIPDNVVKKNRVKQEWEKIPDNDNHLIGFIEKYGFKKCSSGETVFDTRNRLRSEIRARIDSEGK